jgi:hypothetical protein
MQCHQFTCTCKVIEAVVLGKQIGKKKERKNVRTERKKE